MVDAGVLPLIIRNLTAGASEAAAAAAGDGNGGPSSRDSAAGSATSGKDGGEADGEDGDAGVHAAAAAAASTADKASQALSAELVASTLYLVTSLCAVARVVPVAKDGGIIRAVLAGFSRHPTDASVYRNFREVISALDIQASCCVCGQADERRGVHVVAKNECASL